MKENLCILTGPTGIGKSDLSLDLAKDLNAEIISADSMQIYKYMDVGTAKLNINERDNVSHHLIDIVKPNESYTVSDFKNDAKNIIKKVNKKNKLPMVVGGTGLYINSLVYDLNFTEVIHNKQVRDKYERISEDKGLVYLHSLLADVDSLSANKIHINDKKRVIRALEIHETTGKTMSDYNKNFRKENEDYNLVMISLYMDRADLYNKINKRVDKMIERGLVKEVRSILDKGYGPDLIALQGIGYKEINMYFEGTLTLEESVELIKQKSRNYAKRQLTWFRRDKRIKWFNLDKYKDYKDLKYDIKQYIVNALIK